MHYSDQKKTNTKKDKDNDKDIYKVPLKKSLLGKITLPYMCKGMMASLQQGSKKPKANKTYRSLLGFYNKN